VVLHGIILETQLNYEREQYVTDIYGMHTFQLCSQIVGTQAGLSLSLSGRGVSYAEQIKGLTVTPNKQLDPGISYFIWKHKYFYMLTITKQWRYESFKLFK
jgi:hypothetical protein